MITLELPEAVEWTPEALQRLSPEFRYEVRECNLVVMPAAMLPWHADIRSRIRNLLVDQGQLAYIEQGVVLPDGEIRTCDVGVFHKPPAGNVAYRHASEFALLVEVVSDGSRREDRDVKPKLYAAAGIPEYWRVEEPADGEAIVHQYRLARLVDGPFEYAETRVATLTALETT